MPQRLLALVATVFAVALATTPALAAAPQSAIDRAAANARANAAVTKVGTGQQLVVRDAIVDPDGTTHVRFDRTYNGLRVIGGDLVVHSAASGAFLGASLTLAASPTGSTVAKVPQSAALQAASGRLAGVAAGRGSAELVVYARGARPVLAWDTLQTSTLFDGSPSELHVIVDATTGAVLDQWDGIQTAAKDDNGYFNGTVALEHGVGTASLPFRLLDPTRGGQFTCDMNDSTARCYYIDDADGIFGSGSLSNRQTIAVDAQYGTAMTWDYYKLVHGRTGIRNDGKGAYNRVHYGRKYNNAFWSDSCFCMTYGDGDGVTFNPFDSLDVAGHEMSHGVTSRTANLVYSGESGGLNEGTSDIFGTMVEYYAANPNDPVDYLIGEKLYRSGGRALRSMIQPSSDGASADCWYSGVGNLNVHYSSGVANHFFYLLAEGTTSGSPSKTCVAGNTRVATGAGTLAGIGNTKAAAIWYRALTVYMTSGTTYAGARAATITAATNLHGATAAETNAVKAAWAAVNVNER